MRFRVVALLALLSAAAWPQSPQTTVPPSNATKPAASAPAAPTAENTTGPAAKPEDVRDMDSVLHALYDVISGTAGQKRDWDRMRSLFIPGAHLIPTAKRPTGEVSARTLSVDDYIARAEPFFQQEGFFESEVARSVEQYGHIAQVFSTYESRHEKNGKPFVRGINSIQLLNDGKRWWIVNIYWEGETPETPIPDKYLTSGK
jgi:hypothetical protein